MIDRHFFEVALADHVQALGGEAIATIWLKGGSSHRIRRLLDATDGYVIFEAHPPPRDRTIRGGRDVPQAPPSDSASTRPLRVAIAYEVVSYVQVAPAGGRGPEATVQMRG